MQTREHWYVVRTKARQEGIARDNLYLSVHHAPTDSDKLQRLEQVLARTGGPAIVFDFGTATTFDAVSEAGEYLGGAIAPSILALLLG